MAYAKTSLRAEKRALRQKMRATGLGYREISTEFARRYKLRPRAAWREAYGWSLKEAAGRINSQSGQNGLDPGGIAAMTAAHLCEHEAWPGYGSEPSGRRPTPYLLALLAAVYNCAVTDLIDLADREHLPPAELLILEQYSQDRSAGMQVAAQDPAAASPPPAPAARQTSAVPPAACAIPTSGSQDTSSHLDAAASLPLPHVAYRWSQEPFPAGSWIGREVEMAAHDGSAHAERAEQRDIGDATLEQFRSDVIRLSHEYMTGEPFGLFLDMRRVRDRMYAALERRLWPRDSTELYFLLGVLSCLMAVAADDLGYPHAGEELVRSAWAYPTAIDHRPLMARLRLELAGIAFWPRPRQSRDLAASGLSYLSDGPQAAYLNLQFGRAAARLGDAEAARRAIAAAGEARDREHQDDVLEIGGEFDFSRATQHYMAGSTLVEIPGAESEAISQLERAAELYAAGPGPGETHGFGCEAVASIDLAASQLRSGELDGAAQALAAVLSFPSARRIDALPQRLTRVRAELANPRFAGSARARGLDEQIEDFGRDTIVGAMSALPG
jgi:hypothetical protein